MTTTPITCDGTGPFWSCACDIEVRIDKDYAEYNGKVCARYYDVIDMTKACGKYGKHPRHFPFRHRVDGPAEIYYDEDGNIESEYYWYQGFQDGKHPHGWRRSHEKK